MAKGRVIGNNKVKVTGFTAGELSENTYKVTVSGSSSSGKEILSNTAVVLHECAASISLSPDNIKISGECGLTANITITYQGCVNKESTVVSTYPGFTKSCGITGETVYCEFFPYYLVDGESSPEIEGELTVSALDKYGNIITGTCTITNHGVPKGNITLYYEDGETSETATTATVLSSYVSCTLKYALSPYDDTISAGTITVYKTTGEVTGSVVNEGNKTVEASFFSNESRFFERTYTVQLMATNKYGDYVYSNPVVITHSKKGEYERLLWMEFRDGEMIENDAQSIDIYVVFDKNIIDIGTLGFVLWNGSYITEPPEWYDSDTKECFYANGQDNNTPALKDCYVAISALTSDGQEVFADIFLYQERGAYIYIISDDYEVFGTGTTEAVSSCASTYYDQSRSFKIKYLGIDPKVYSPGLASVGGTVTRNRDIISLSYPQNINDRELTFIVSVSGTAEGGNINVSYTFRQAKKENIPFLLYYGNEESKITISGKTTAFALTVSHPSDYTNIDVYLNDPDFGNNRIYDWDFSPGGVSSQDIMTCYVFQNMTPNDLLYELQLSAKTPDGYTVYSQSPGEEVFTVNHKSGADTGYIRITGTGTTVDVSGGTKTVEFKYENLKQIYVLKCESDSGEYIEYRNLNAPITGTSGSTQVVIPGYPVNSRTVTVQMGGVDNKNRAVMSGVYVITQEGTGEPNIIVREYSGGPENYSFTGESTERNFSYYVEYVACESGLPIYNDFDFSSVSNTGATLKNDNGNYGDLYYFITFTATGHSGEDLRAFVDITQKGVTPTIVVYDRRGGEPTTAFTVEANETSVNLYVEYNGCYYNECVYNPDRGDIMLQNQYLITIDGENTDTRDRNWTLTIKAIGYGTDEDPTKTITVKQKGRTLHPAINILDYITRQPITSVTIPWYELEARYIVEMTDCEWDEPSPMAPFERITETSATLDSANIFDSPNTYVITFMGKNSMGTVVTSKQLSVIQQACTAELELLAPQGLQYDSASDSYFVPLSGGSYIIEHSENEIEGITASTTGNAITSYTRDDETSWELVFEDISREYISGETGENSVNLPVGNLAAFYYPGSITVNEDGTGSDSTEGDTYVYNISLAAAPERTSTMQLTGESHGYTFNSNVIKFIQTNREPNPGS